MVTEMGQGWAADISRFVLEHGPEVIIPFSRLHAEASRSGHPLNSPPNVLDVCYDTYETNEEKQARRGVPFPSYGWPRRYT